MGSDGHTSPRFQASRRLKSAISSSSAFLASCSNNRSNSPCGTPSAKSLSRSSNAGYLKKQPHRSGLTGNPCPIKTPASSPWSADSQHAGTIHLYERTCILSSVSRYTSKNHKNHQKQKHSYRSKGARLRHWDEPLVRAVRVLATPHVFVRRNVLRLLVGGGRQVVVQPHDLHATALFCLSKQKNCHGFDTCYLQSATHQLQGAMTQARGVLPSLLSVTYA